MLMDILMESLLAMDEDTLNAVLESCSDAEIDIIDDMVMEARIEDGPTIQSPTITDNEVSRNISENLKSRGWFKNQNDKDLYNDAAARLSNSYKTIKSDKRKAKQQGAENARKISAADLKSRLLTGEALNKHGKDKILSEHKDRPAYREANSDVTFHTSREYDNGSTAYKKIREMAKARRLKGGVDQYIRENYLKDKYRRG